MLKMNALCVRCLINKHTTDAYKLDKEKASAFCKDLLPVVQAGVGCANSCRVASDIYELYRKHFGIGHEIYDEEKRLSNDFVLQRLPQIRQLVQQQEDPVFAALQFSILGNYLDFAALKGQVSFEKLEEMLQNALSMELPRDTYGEFCHQLSHAKTLLYVTDNAGEIGFDRILAEEIQKAYPGLQITFCVRGLPTHNDATREDAAIMGIPFPIIDTGNDVCGVEWDMLSEETKAVFRASDVILTKGMGNVETLYGIDLNIYQAFLVKCDLIMEVFDKPLMTPMFVHTGA